MQRKVRRTMKEKCKKQMARILTALLVVAVVIGFVPQMGMPIYGASGDPAMNLGTEVLDQNVNTTNAQTVWYADKTWRVIGYDGNGAASDSGTATLLAAGNLDQSAFDESGNNSNVYANSTLKTKVDAIAGSLTEGEQGAVKKRTLVHGTHDGSYTDCVAGDADIPDVLLWPLSTKEANAVNESLRIVDPEHPSWATSWWWLRSPGAFDDSTALVYGDGGVDYFGISVFNTFGVRPAFYLNLESVLFTSAAEGGKSSGTEGADALKAQSDQTNSGDEWKVTVTDDAHSGFAVSNVTAAENGVSVTYTGAATGTNEYISAIITDSSANITYYGRVKNCTSASDTVTINTAGKLGTGDTLYVFNEQYNGDKKTDYASALQEVTIPEPVTYYTVTFVDGQGKTLKTEKVESGKAATAPADPKRSGYTFTGWDKDFSKVTAGLTVTAQWKKAAATVSGTLLAKMTAKGKSRLVLTWSKVKGAEGYDIFFNKCGKKPPKKIKTIKGSKTFKWTKKSLKKKTAYKAVVKAYVTKNGKKTYVRTSPMVYAYTSGGTKNYTNSKSVTVKKTSVSLKTGKTYKIKASVTKLQKGKKLMPSNHAPKLRYVSSNKKIATVSKSGKITAKSKGSCKVYVIAVNGARKAITVTVK